MLDGRSSWGKFWDSVVRLQWEKASPWMGLRNAVGVTIPVVIGAAFGSLPAGLSAALGALNVAFADSSVPYFKRAQRMLAASVLTAISVLVGAACGYYHWLTLPAAIAWAFAAGMLVALDQTAADLGTVSLVTLLVFAGLAIPPDRAPAAAMLAFAGGILQTALSVARWPIRRYAPERRALSELFEALADSASHSARATEPPPTTTQIIYAQETMGTLDRDRSVQAERFRALLSQAERMRIALLTLSRLRVRLGRETPASAMPIDCFLSLAAGTLRSLAAERPAASSPEIRECIDSLRQFPGQTARDARRQMDALAGQLRAAADLADGTAPAGAARFARREAARSWRLRLQGTVAILRANLSLQSAACRHAIRLAVCVGIGEVMGRTLGLTRSYWAPMTIAIVLKPDFGSTVRTGVLRLTGTFAGLGLATALFHLAPPATRLEIALMGLAVFFARAYGAANYSIATTGVTATVVFLLALGGVSPDSVIAARALNTVAGGVVALAAYTIWPTWERSRLGETLARMLEAYRDYFHEIRNTYAHPETASPAELDQARLAGRRARTNLEASVDRLGAEPGTPPDRMRILGGMLANSHRLAHAMMALEAGLQISRPAPARPPFHALAEDVEKTLDRLAGALRGKPLDAATLPDLREDHHALLAAGQSETERYALVNVEADRIVNSLNTLAVDVAMWTAASPS